MARFGFGGSLVLKTNIAGARSNENHQILTLLLMGNGYGKWAGIDWGDGVKNINDMTRKEFDALPDREWCKDIGPFSSMVILPGRSRDLHDSGYRCMDFVAVDATNKPICRLAGGSDVLHIDGIGGGYGDNWLEKYKTVPPSAWSVDCLPKSGLLRLFRLNQSGSGMTCGSALSSFEVYAS